MGRVSSLLPDIVDIHTNYDAQLMWTASSSLL